MFDYQRHQSSNFGIHRSKHSYNAFKVTCNASWIVKGIPTIYLEATDSHVHSPNSRQFAFRQIVCR